MTETFIHESVEVKLTGRTAEKILKAITSDREARTLILHEITPVDSFAGDWKKWVNITDLYKVAV